MGYLRFIRVATCCIVIQVALLSVASTLPTDQSNSNNPERVVKVKDVVVKEIEDEPGKIEEHDLSNHQTQVNNEDVKTAKGRRMVKSRAEVDNEKHEQKQTEFSDNQIGRRTDVHSTSSLHNAYDGSMRTKETSGTATETGMAVMGGDNDEMTVGESVHQETDGGYTETTKDKKQIGRLDSKRANKSFEDRKDDDHVEKKILHQNEFSDLSSDSETTRDTYVHGSNGDLIAVVNKDLVLNEDLNKSKTTQTKHLEVEPGKKTSSAQVITDSSNTNTSVKQHDSNIHRDTPIHELYVHDHFSDEHTKGLNTLKVETLKKTETKETGTTLMHSKTNREEKRAMLKHNNKFTMEVIPKMRNAQPMKVQFETEILDKDNYRIRQTKESETKNISPNGSTKEENVVEERNESYDMHSIEKPKSTEKPKAEDNQNGTVIASSVKDKPKNETGDAKQMTGKAPQKTPTTTTATKETKTTLPLESQNEKTQKKVKTVTQKGSDATGVIVLLVPPSRTSHVFKGQIAFVESLVNSSATKRIVDEMIQGKAAFEVVDVGTVDALLKKDLKEYMKTSEDVMGVAVLSFEKNETVVYNLISK